MQLGIIVRFATDTEKFFLLRASSFLHCDRVHLVFDVGSIGRGDGSSYDLSPLSAYISTNFFLTLNSPPSFKLSSLFSNFLILPLKKIYYNCHTKHKILSLVDHLVSSPTGFNSRLLSFLVTSFQFSFPTF
jgi:hypothetical protein